MKKKSLKLHRLKKCKQCGCYFIPNDREQFCSKGCYRIYMGFKEPVKKVKKVKDIRTCIVCGREYEARAPNQIFCSEECRMIAKSSDKSNCSADYVPYLCRAKGVESCFTCDLSEDGCLY